MQKTTLPVALLLAACYCYGGEMTTPLDAYLPEDQVTDITCLFRVTQDEALELGSYYPEEDPLRAPRAGLCHYQVYIPPGYNEDKERTFPVLFITSSKGRPSMHNVLARMKRDGWIAVMLPDSKEKDPKWLGNFLGAHDDLVKRCRIMQDMKFSTGSKKGGRMASAYGVYRPGFRGYIAQGACFWDGSDGNHRYDAAARNPGFLVFAYLGTEHPSWRCLEVVKRDLPKHARYRAVCVEKGGTWASEEIMNRAFDWIEAGLFLSPRLCRPSKEACEWWYRNRLAALERAKSDFDKYEIMEQIVLLHQGHKFTRDKEARDKVSGFKKTLRDMMKQPGIKQELEARKAFLMLEARDDRQVTVRNKGIALAFSYRAMARKYKDTKYAHRAEQRAEALEFEFLRRGQ